MYISFHTGSSSPPEDLWTDFCKIDRVSLQTDVLYNIKTLFTLTVHGGKIHFSRKADTPLVVSPTSVLHGHADYSAACVITVVFPGLTAVPQLPLPQLCNSASFSLSWHISYTPNSRP